MFILFDLAIWFLGFHSLKNADSSEQWYTHKSVHSSIVCIEKNRNKLKWVLLECSKDICHIRIVDYYAPFTEMR